LKTFFTAGPAGEIRFVCNHWRGVAAGNFQAKASGFSSAGPGWIGAAFLRAPPVSPDRFRFSFPPAGGASRKNKSCAVRGFLPGPSGREIVPDFSCRVFGDRPIAGVNYHWKFLAARWMALLSRTRIFKGGFRSSQWALCG
jgi:hypothetical protein